MKAIDHVLDHRLDVGSVEDSFLRTIVVEDLVEDESLALRAEARLRRGKYAAKEKGGQSITRRLGVLT